MRSGEIAPEMGMPGESDFGGDGGSYEAPPDPRSALPIYAGVAAFLLLAVGGLVVWARARNAAFEAWMDEDPTGQRRKKYVAAQKKKATDGGAD